MTYEISLPKRCPECDLPFAVDNGHGMDGDGCECAACAVMCWREWNGFCHAPKVDWRTRALHAECLVDYLCRNFPMVLLWKDGGFELPRDFVKYTLADGTVVDLEFRYTPETTLWDAYWEHAGVRHTLNSGMETCHASMTDAWDQIRGKGLSDLLK